MFLPGEFHGQRRLAGYNPWSHKEPDTTEHARACMQAEVTRLEIKHLVTLARRLPPVSISLFRTLCSEENKSKAK